MTATEPSFATNTARLHRLETANRRLTLALTGASALGLGAVLGAFAQPGGLEPIAGIAIEPEFRMLYRVRTDGSLERLRLDGGRVVGGTPVEWETFDTGVVDP